MSDLINRLRVKDPLYTEFWTQELMDEAADRLEIYEAAISTQRSKLDAIDAQVAAYMGSQIGSSQAIRAIDQILHPEESK